MAFGWGWPTTMSMLPANLQLFHRHYCIVADDICHRHWQHWWTLAMGMAPSSVKAGSPCPPLSQALMSLIAALMPLGWTLALGMVSNNVLQMQKTAILVPTSNTNCWSIAASHTIAMYFNSQLNALGFATSDRTYLQCRGRGSKESPNSCIEVETLLGKQTLQTLIVIRVALAEGLWEFLEDFWPLRLNKLNEITNKGLRWWLCAGCGPLCAQARTIQVEWDLSCKLRR